MSNQVSVVRDNNGNAVRISENNPAYGYILLQQKRTKINDNIFNLKNINFVNQMKLTAIIKGKVEDLLDLDLNFNGKIIAIESLEPFTEVNPERFYKRAGKDGPICCVGGAPIYRTTIYTEDLNAQDQLIAHDNGDAMKGNRVESQVESQVEDEELFEI